MSKLTLENLRNAMSPKIRRFAVCWSFFSVGCFMTDRQPGHRLCTVGEMGTFHAPVFRELIHGPGFLLPFSLKRFKNFISIWYWKRKHESSDLRWRLCNRPEVWRITTLELWDRMTKEMTGSKITARDKIRRKSFYFHNPFTISKVSSHQGLHTAAWGLHIVHLSRWLKCGHFQSDTAWCLYTI